jgi:arylsulfatase A-like enzyme
MLRIARMPAVVVVIAFLSWGEPVALGQTRPPNIVLLVADDMGYADIGVHGSKDIPTPSIDALAKAGVRFTDAYVTGPYCSPTRAGLLTGRYPQRFGHEFNIGPGGEFGLPLSETTLADRLRAAGYRTAVFGKWHLGAGEKFHPMSRGFDEFFGFLGGQHSYMDTAAQSVDPILDGRKPATAMTYLTDALATRAVDFIRREKARPFLLYLAFNAVHTPMHATDKYLARFKDVKDSQRRTYAAMLSAMDDAIGRTMATIRDERLEENTLVIFFSDNGGPTMPGTTINGSSNGPLRGSKRQTWEGGIRVPFIIRWKGHVPEGKTDARPIIQLDVLPTALAAAGVPLGNQSHIDGVNLLPFITGKSQGPVHEALYWRLGGMMAIRKGDWKLVKTQEGPLPGDPSVLSDLSAAELYNLAADIGETKNLAPTNAAKAKELANQWQRWNRELAKPLWPAGRGAAQ